jgi:glyoxylase-like metal-dependent hydrolase (beta-lactamase superfamily II)
MPLVRIDLCGVRGSLPATGAEYARVGGNTSCIALSHDGQQPTLVLDAGTGLRRLSTLMNGEAFRGTLIVGHLHWDHIMGVPFFSAGDRLDASVRMMAPEQGPDLLTLLEANGRLVADEETASTDVSTVEEEELSALMGEKEDYSPADEASDESWED